MTLAQPAAFMRVLSEAESRTLIQQAGGGITPVFYLARMWLMSQDSKVLSRLSSVLWSPCRPDKRSASGNVPAFNPFSNFSTNSGTTWLAGRNISRQIHYQPDSVQDSVPGVRAMQFRFVNKPSRRINMPDVPMAMKISAIDNAI